MDKSLIKEFAPWIAFTGIIGMNIAGITTAAIVAAILVFKINQDNLKRGMILEWVGLGFFILVLMLTGGLHYHLTDSTAMFLANAVLAGIVWFTILINKPFTESYAKRDVPKEFWHSKEFKKINLQCSLLWAGILGLMAFGSFIALFVPHLSNLLNNYLPIPLIIFGVYATEWLVGEKQSSEVENGAH